MAKLLPIILLLIGAAAGGGAGLMFKPEPVEECVEEACEDLASEEEAAPEDEVEPTYVAMKNQFVVPVIQDAKVKSLVVLSLSLETLLEDTEVIFSSEPKLRDVFLRALFDHAHIGGFDGAFTESGRLSILRVALLEAAQSVIGPDISDILITDIVRQEM
jgi:hypothetical protein